MKTAKWDLQTWAQGEKTNQSPRDLPDPEIEPRSPALPEKAMAPHSSTLAWKIPWTEEPGGLRPMGSLRVGHDWVTSLSPFTFMHWRRKWQPTPVFLPGESRGGGAWWAAVYGVAQGRTWLKRLSSRSSSCTTGRFFTNWTTSPEKPWNVDCFKC